MTMIYKIRCDACKMENIAKLPHIEMRMRPGFKGVGKELHFCNPKCVGNYVGNLSGIYEAHVAALSESRK